MNNNLDWLDKLPKEDGEQIETYIERINELISVLDSISHDKNLLDRFGEEYIENVIDNCNDWVEKIHKEIWCIVSKKMVDVVSSDAEAQKDEIYDMYNSIKVIDERIYTELKTAIVSKLISEPYSLERMFLNLVRIAKHVDVNALLEERSVIANKRDEIMTKLSTDFAENSEFVKYMNAIKRNMEAGTF